jgi:hypothetical protein
MKEVCRAIKNTPFFVEKGYKIGINGITKQKEGSFQARYGQGCRYEHLPNGLIVRRTPSCPIDKTTSKRIPKTRFGYDDDIGAVAPIKEKTVYKLNKKKIRNRIQVYVDLMRRSKKWKTKELFFWTITFPEKTPDDICYRLLNTWLTSCRQKNILHSYFWVSERQKNSTIHFHLLIPHRMNAKYANQIMMTSICTMIRKGLLKGSIAAAKRYNGVDIAKTRKKGSNKGPVINFLEKKRTKLLAWYLSKYVSKNNTEMNRLCWNCSTDWSIPFHSVHLTRDELVAVVRTRDMIIEQRRFENDYVEFWPWRHGPPTRFLQHICDINTFLLTDYFEEIRKQKIFLN